MAQYRLKKSLGQHFLHDEVICQNIVQAIQQYPVVNLLEVGPGAGALTKYLMKWPNINFKMVELDSEKVAFLHKTYPKLKGKIIEADFLKIDPPFEEPFYIIGNFPYNISTQILFQALDWGNQVQGIVGMFQKEVAQRIASGPGSKVYGITSVLLQAYYDVTYLFDVPPKSFTPPPKVMSGIISLTPTAQIPTMRSRKHFFMLVKAAFNQRRKTLRNAVKHLFPPEALTNDIFNKRAEQLSIEDFAQLTFTMN